MFNTVAACRRCWGFQPVLALLLTLGSLSGSILHAASDSSYGQIPLAFTANRGQVHHSVRFTAKGPGLTAYFTPGEVVVNLRQSTVRMRYLGANAAPDIDGADMQEGRANYLIGDDPSLWRTNVPLYGRVVYKDLYPGIDMVYSSHKRLLKSEFVVAPGADPSQIRIAYTGVESLRIDDQGGLILTTAEGDLREEAPEIYQEESDGRDQIEGAFRVAGNVVTFSVGQYDRSRPLRIDPVLSYSTYLGGGGTDRAYAIAVDGAGAAYVTGYTDSTNFPVTAGVVRPTSGGGVDAFVTKLNAAGSAIVYSTYLGGNGDDRGFSIAVDASGNAYITGYTSSTNFPLSSPFQATLKGPRDAFVTKLNPSGAAPIFSTYLGGTGDDRGNGIAVSASGLVYVTGSTTSSNFPLSSPFQATLGGQQDGFVTKLNSTGSALLYSTYLGGAADDRGSSIALDSGGAAYIAGNTSSTNFPTASPLQAANNSATDAFVTKLSAAGALVYSTYLGGSGTENIEVGRSIAVDSAGSAYIAGTTTSTNFPLFQPLQAAIKGGIYDAFVVKLTSAGTAFVFSTFLGGSSIDFGQSIAVDSSGNSYVTGYTSSTNFPIVNAGQPVNGGGNDTFVLKLNASGTALTESGFLGGGDTDTGYGIAIDNSGNAYVTGLTLSSNFPLLGPVQSANGGTLAAFVSKFTFGATGPPTAVSVSPASGNGSSQTFSLLYSDSRGFADINFVEMNWNATQSTANACYLRYSRATGVLQLATNAGSGWIGSATIGAAGTLANTQCSVDAGASSASGSGNNLTVTLVLTFNSAFAGSKNIYMQVQDTANTLAPWQARGTWTVVVSAPPAAVSVSPASGSGTTQAFSFAYSDTLGFTDVNFIEFLFQSSLSMQNACYARYVPFTNILSLYNDAATGYAGAATLGAAGTLTNGQCTINVGASSVQGAGDNLTLTVALTFKPAFGGAKNIYMIAVSQGSVSSGWQAKGTWSVPIAPDASVVSVSPASGSGSSQVFSFLYSDLAGYADINWVQMHFQTQLVAPGACYLQYTRATNVIQLVSDSGDGYAGSLAVGIAGTLNNSQCTLDAGSSSVSVSGTNLTLNLALVFKPAFAGAKNISMGATNNANAFSGWQAKGTWTVTSGGSLPAASVSVTPAAGAGSSQTFGFLYSDSYGFTDINWVQMHIQTQLVANAACYIQYTRSTHNVQLINDAGTGFVGAGGIVGSAGTLANSQCTLDTGASSVSGAGNNLTVNLALSFQPAFQGPKTVSMGATTNASVFSGWQATGSWTVTQPGNLPPANVSVAPSSGAGSSQTFGFTYSDPYGYTDIGSVQMHLGSQLVANSVCYIQYTRATNTAQLLNDAGTGYVGSGGILGGAGTLTNSQCTLNLGSSSASGSGNNLTVNLALAFKPGFAGAKNTSMNVSNNASVSAGWQVKGTWTAQ